MLDIQISREDRMYLVDPDSALDYRKAFLETIVNPTDGAMLPFPLRPPHPEEDYIGLRAAWRGVSAMA
jgi:hypothetical protein